MQRFNSNRSTDDHSPRRFYDNFPVSSHLTSTISSRKHALESKIRLPLLNKNRIEKSNYSEIYNTINSAIRVKYKANARMIKKRQFHNRLNIFNRFEKKMSLILPLLILISTCIISLLYSTIELEGGQLNVVMNSSLLQTTIPLKRDQDIDPSVILFTNSLALPLEPQKNHFFKRVVFYASSFYLSSKTFKQFLDPMLHVNPGEEAISQTGHHHESYRKGDCVPMQTWQTQSYPTCNLLHELDIALPGQHTSFKRRIMKDFDKKNNHGNITSPHDDYLFLIIGKGWFRHVWKVIRSSVKEEFVLKTLRPDRDFLDEYYDLARKDSVAMERLTQSPFVLNVHGYCGQSVINEYANFFDGFQDFRDFANQLKDKNDPKILKLKLKILAMISLGVAHVHEIDGKNNATMVHYDINPSNIAITKGGIPKLNDFNMAQFLRWNVKKKKRCGFSARLFEPWWRSPEEMIMPSSTNETEGAHTDIDEKSDIYSLGNIIFFLLTGHSPRTYTRNKKILLETRDIVKKGVEPVLSNFYIKSKQPAIIVMREALKRCYNKVPERRSTASEIADYLLGALAEIESNGIV